MRICAIGDGHGNLNFSVKESDLLLISGDMLPCSYRDKIIACSQQENFIRDELIPWLKRQPVKDVVIIGGNHDWIFDISLSQVPKWPSNVHYLQDSEIEINGLRIYGTPQQPIFLTWAFNRTEEQLEKYFNNIPERLDILLCHTSPYKIMDEVNLPNKVGNFGCKILKKTIDRVKPKNVIFGHFHGCYGKIKKKGINYINCSLLDEDYKMVKSPIYMEI